jgi:hypothetical protein
MSGRVGLVSMVFASLVAAAASVVSGQESSPAPAPPVAAGPVKATANPDIERLRERAAAFWAARVEGDSKSQWELLEPRGRGRLTPGEYAPARGALKFFAYQVEDATVRGHFADVRVRLLVQPNLPPTSARTTNMGPATTVVKDRWIRIGGTWYRSLEQEGAQPETEQQ